MKIETRKVKLSEIKPNPDNPRQVTGAQMDKLVKSLQEFPDMMEIREIVVDESMMILGGNMRYQALKKIKAKECIAKVVKGLTDEQKREFIIKDNANFGQWDFDILANDWDSLPLDDWGVDLPTDWLDEKGHSWGDMDRSEKDHRFEQGKSDEIILSFVCSKDEYQKIKEILLIENNKQIIPAEVLLNAIK